MTHAIVLIEAEPVALPLLGGALADLEGVAEAYSVTGDWDFVVIVRVPSVDGVAEVVRNRIAQLEGIRRTHTMLAFEAFSRHDLESLFSIGHSRSGGDQWAAIRAGSASRAGTRSCGRASRGPSARCRWRAASGRADDGTRAGHQRARRAVVAALAEDPQPAAGGVVVEGLA